MNYHIPVMVKEIVKFLNIKPDNWYVDCSLGGGGHTKEILKRGGKVLGIDLDKDSIRKVADDFNLEVKDINGQTQATSNNLILINNNFVYVEQIVKSLSIKPVMGILFDLGVSSHQLETASRGFSFNLDTPLDMRMDQTANIPTAKDLIDGLTEHELAELFWKLGEEKFSKKVARKIAEQRKLKKIETTNQLAQIILSAKPKSRDNHIHPATKVFQALRIAVNDELNSLKEALPKALEILDPEGRLVAISFHSLEDRIVKNSFKKWEEDNLAKILTKKPTVPTEEEVQNNPRARSGKLRAIEKSYGKTGA